ncbi:hypothetical protein [Erwinia amylovora]|uniref:hypothetical protein n=1 Tax=Erwinia amylovora TaxID=552 RepID=UPI0020BDBD7E|nr:hypothetical protein [Erwinia amylovora]MCK8417615.1 hypothetical protein [Erwinia amylovora]
MNKHRDQFAGRVHYVLWLISLAFLVAGGIWHCVGGRVFDSLTGEAFFASHPLVISACWHLPAWLMMTCGAGLLLTVLMADLLIHANRLLATASLHLRKGLGTRRPH